MHGSLSAMRNDCFVPWNEPMVQALHYMLHHLLFPDHTVCQTVHMFSTEKMESVSVEKRCVRPSACTEEHVGCELSDDGATKVG